MANYGVCPNPTCNIIKAVPWGEIYRGIIKGCPRCGKPLIVRCPYCSKYIEHREGIFCFHCLKPFKAVLKLAPQPGQNLPRKDGSRKPSK